jgi:hypothetical protein
MIRKYYMAEAGEGGGGEEKKKYKGAPEGYVPQTSLQRKNWNDLLDAMQKEGLAGSSKLDAPDSTDAVKFLEKYNTENPDKAIDPKTIPFIQYEQKALRSGEEFPGTTGSQLKTLRTQMSPDYLKRDVAEVGSPFGSALSREYYPSFSKGGKDYGTDIEGYVKDSFVPPIPASEGLIPLPDFKNAKSRGQFASAFKKKYSNIFQDVPEKIQYAIGDFPLNVNQTPRAGKSTSKEIVQKYGKQYDIDPALLYTSFMAEGGSGLYKSEATGLDTRNRKPGEYGYQGFYGDKEFPINGPESFGFTTFSDRFPELVKGGYLPKNFEKEFRGKKGAGEFGQDDFKSVESAMQGKAALMKFSRDEVDEWAKKHDIQLSPKAREFFMLAAFNGGEGGFQKRMLEYKKEGLLEGDKFLNKRPQNEDKVKGTTADVWGHVVPRLRLREAMKSEKQFEDENNE